MRDAVDRDAPRRAAAAVGASGRLHLVVGRPEHVRVVAQRVQEHQQQRDEDGHGHRCGGPAEQSDEQRAHQREPHQRRRAQERQRGEHGDAEQAAEQVQPVGLQPWQVPEAGTDDLTGPRHDGRDGQEHRRQNQPECRAARGDGAEEDQVAAGAVDGDGVGADEADEAEQRDQRVQRHRPCRGALARGAQETQADPEERPQQHEVREVRQVHDVRAEPADERQFEGEHQGAGQAQTPAHAHWADVTVIGWSQRRGRAKPRGRCSRSTRARPARRRSCSTLDDGVLASAPTHPSGPSTAAAARSR